MTGSALRVAIGAGGNRGHLAPAVELAHALVALTPRPGVEIEFFGAAGGPEEQVVAGTGHRLFTTPAVSWDAAPARTVLRLMASATRAAAQRLQSAGTDVVIGMGGWASLPVALAAPRCGIPLLVYEPNAVLGRANRLASRLTRHRAVAFEGDLSRRGRARVVGVPLSETIARFDLLALREEARRRFGLHGEQRLVVVRAGGADGRRLAAAAAGLTRWWNGREDLRVIIETGHAQLRPIQRLIAHAPAFAAVAAFERMDWMYAAADLIVTRSEATAVAEIAATGVPSILVPSPRAYGDHQRHNAAALTAVGGARLFHDHHLDGLRLAAALDELLTAPPVLARMASAAGEAARPQAAVSLARWALDLVPSGRRSSGEPGGDETD